uniref:Major facilitator superfamily (MFS) profile domain-containing protein n=1 Tax=Calcidiscus leptoporus TaxID=127549 RepID=A0A7S0J4Y5_9EUKA
MGSSLMWPRVLAMGAICVYGSAFAFSLGPIPNILTAELFPMRAKSAAMAASLGAQFFFNTCVGMGFPILRHKIGAQAVFTGFGAVCFVAWLFVNRFVFETKGASLEQLSSKGDE